MNLFDSGNSMTSPTLFFDSQPPSRILNLFIHPFACHIHHLPTLSTRGVILEFFFFSTWSSNNTRSNHWHSIILPTPYRKIVSLKTPLFLSPTRITSHTQLLPASTRCHNRRRTILPTYPHTSSTRTIPPSNRTFFYLFLSFHPDPYSHVSYPPQHQQ
jgi:hypothetical protein